MKSTLRYRGSGPHHLNTPALGTGLFGAGSAFGQRRLSRPAVEDYQPARPQSQPGQIAIQRRQSWQLTQAKLRALTRWIASAPGFALTYPDLESALAMIGGLPLATPPTPR